MKSLVSLYFSTLLFWYLASSSTSLASRWASMKLPAKFLDYKKKYNSFLRSNKKKLNEDDKDALPWWHKNSKERRNEQDVTKRTCGKDCTGHVISPLCVAVRHQPGVFHQFWSRCEFNNYFRCNKGVAKQFRLTEGNFCRQTLPHVCIRDCNRKSLRPVCVTGDPINDDYTYGNRCFFEVARCVARVNRGVTLRVRHPGVCDRRNPHRFPSSFHRLWFIKTV